MRQFHIKFTSIAHRLPYLVMSIILSSCWFCCEHQDTPQPIRKQYIGLREYDRLLEEVPKGIHQFPLLVLGWFPADIGCTTTNIINPNLKDYIKDPHMKEDMSVDFNPDADIQMDAWDPLIIPQIKSHDKFQKAGQFRAIIFERIGVLPVYWGKYLQAWVAQPTNDIYQFPDNMDKLVDMDTFRANQLGSRANRKKFYETGFGYFSDLQKTPLSALKLSNKYHIPDLAIDPQLVTVTSTQDGLFQEEESGLPRYPQLEQLINGPVPVENTILRDYYELLAPGGWLIFSSTANIFNRFGGLVVAHQGKMYTPFKDLDDLNMQAVYRSIFERAGFVNIQFYKDPYFAENVILLVAKKM